MAHLRGLQQTIVVDEGHEVEDEECRLETVVEVEHCEDDETEVQLQHQAHGARLVMEEVNL